jgi:hypothetical protein
MEILQTKYSVFLCKDFDKYENFELSVGLILL